MSAFAPGVPNHAMLFWLGHGRAASLSASDGSGGAGGWPIVSNGIVGGPSNGKLIITRERNTSGRTSAQ